MIKPNGHPFLMAKAPRAGSRRAKVESFKAVEGELHLTSKVNVWVVSDLQMGDFVAELEVKIPQENSGFNSGLGFRLIGDKGKPKGYQCEIDRSKPAGVYGIGMGGWLFPKGKEQTDTYQQSKPKAFLSLRNGIISKWKPKARVSARGSTASPSPILNTSNPSRAALAFSITAKVAQ